MNHTSPSDQFQLLVDQATAIRNTYLTYNAEIDLFYTQINAVEVFMMQCGFAFVEAGSVQTKSVTNIIMKNFIDCLIGGIVWYLWAFGICFGSGNQFIGERYQSFSGPDGNSGAVQTNWFFQYTFAAASTTIVSGALGGRARFPTYLFFSLFCTGWIYPIATHWMWSVSGFLSPFYNEPTPKTLPLGAIDFAGSGVVHLIGGTASLVGATIIGPRIGRFTPDWDGDKPGTLRTFRSLWSGLGTFLLWYGWYGFNPGSSQMAIGKSDVNALACINSTLGACSGAIVAMFLHFFFAQTWDLGRLCNGLLAGLVAITGGCTTVQPWAAIIIGLLAGAFYFGASLLILHFKIDDPVEAIPVHFANGLWGLISIGLFADQGLILRAYGEAQAKHWGAFMGGGGLLLGIQLLAILCLASWTTLWSFLYFYPVHRLGWLRVNPVVEKVGLDLEHVEMTAAQKKFLYAPEPPQHPPDVITNK